MYRLTDRSQPAHEIVCPSLGISTLVMEADQVAQDVVAEDDTQSGTCLFYPVRLIQAVGVADVPTGVAADKALRRPAQNLLIRADPADAMAHQKRQHGLADRAFRRPQAGR